MENDSYFARPEDRSRSRRATAPHARVAGGADLPDEATLADARAGDRAAIEALLAAVRPRLMAIALRIVRTRDDAEDVAQEAMIKVCKHLPRFEGRAALSTWLHRIVVNTALDRLRGDAARVGHAATFTAPDRGDDLPSSDPQITDERTPEAVLVERQIATVVHGALAALSPSHREVLTLREIEGESYRSIATLSRCPVGTVMSRLHHARRRLTAELAAGGAAVLLAA